MSGNIWEVVSIKDLVQIIQNNKNKFIIIAITQENSPASEKKMLKKFLKSKCGDYPNMYFTYYVISKKDLGRISLFTKDETQYPLVYHIYNTEIFVKVNRANQKTLYESFDKVKQYYDKDKEKFLSGEDEDNLSDDNGNDDIQDEDVDEDVDDDVDDIGDIDDIGNDKLSKKQTEPIQQLDKKNGIKNGISDQMQQQQMLQEQNKISAEQKILETKKMFDKIIMMQKHAREFNVEFLKDIQQRKKEEYDQKVKDRESKKTDDEIKVKRKK
jgi:hypothetical protein